MYDIYVPYNDLDIYSNYYFNEDLSIIYATNDNVNYDIIDVNNHYNIVNSDIDLSESVLIPINKDLLTNNWTYRNDLSDVLINLCFFCLFFFGIPLFLLSRFFKKKF